MRNWREIYQQRLTTPYFTVDSLTVTWFPPKDKSREEYLRVVMGDDYMTDSILSAYDTKLQLGRYKADSGSLHLLPPFLPAGWDSDPVE